MIFFRILLTKLLVPLILWGIKRGIAIRKQRRTG